MGSDRVSADRRGGGADERPAVGADVIEAGSAETADGAAAPRARWWRRDHPLFTPLAGFFTGLLVVLVVPTSFGAVLSAAFDLDTAEHVFPFVAIVLAVPVALAVVPRTRTFGLYMLLGMLLTAVVVLAVGALTLWFLVAAD